MLDSRLTFSRVSSEELVLNRGCRNGKLMISKESRTSVSNVLDKKNLSLERLAGWCHETACDYISPIDKCNRPF